MHSILSSFIDNRKLIWRLVKRDLQARYRGSMLGMAWTVLTPLFLLLVFTFVFSVVFQSRWNVEVTGKGQFALILFCGLIIYQMFADCANRAPTLLLENVAYIKKVVFPLDTLAWVSVGGALVNFLISYVLLLIGQLVLIGTLHWTMIFLPLVLLPLMLFVVGSVWLLSSVGMYIRDLKQLVGVVVTMLMFLSPIFYPIQAIPEGFRIFIYLNPLAFMMEQLRAITLFGNVPNIPGLALITGLMLAFFLFSGWWFNKVKKGFADVV
jgi:lipopolysaccharide transport system permease protein